MHLEDRVRWPLDRRRRRRRSKKERKKGKGKTGHETMKDTVSARGDLDFLSRPAGELPSYDTGRGLWGDRLS
jgi:hypothetical protein